MTRILLLAIALVVTGCDDQSMRQQNRYDTYAPSTFWPNGSEAQPLPAGVVAQGDIARAADATQPPPVTDRLIQTGRENFDVFCSPCHGLSGDGNGVIVRRGFPAPPSYHTDRLRETTARHLFEVMTNGYGVMYSYAAHVSPHDRWAIVAYIRALQEARHARVADMPQVREKLP
jgi:mono/diheme cytochrome c family protein